MIKYLVLASLVLLMGCTAEDKYKETLLDVCIKGCKAMGRQIESFKRPNCVCGVITPCKGN